jgi:adenosylmethionine-8-amino-7-oxononanoate aminotransferase
MGAVGIHERVARPIIDNGEFNHGLTCSGHPVAAAVAVANLKLLRDEGIVERVKRDTGPYFQALMRDTFAQHPIVGEVHGQGMVASLQLARRRPSAAASRTAARWARSAATSASTATWSCVRPATGCCCRRRS